MIKSPLRYPGGKSRAVKFLEPLIADGEEFREPFVGGGSIWINLSQIKNYNKIWINDLNYSLSCFWKSALRNNEKLAREVDKFFLNKNRSLYDEMVSWKTENYLEEGTRFFVLNRITFSGVTESGGYSRQSHEKRFTQSSIDRLRALSNLETDKVKVTSLDFEDVINKPGDNVVIFLDPPYYSAQKSKLYGKDGDLHTGFDHERLHEVLKKSSHKWIMTYDNSEYIRELYKDFHTYEWSLQYGMTNKKSDLNNELLISNYKLNI